MLWDVKIQVGDETKWELLGVRDDHAAGFVEGLLMDQGFPQEGRILVTPHPEPKVVHLRSPRIKKASV